MSIEPATERRAQVVTWRRDRLATVGVPPSQAARLARDSRCDVHALIELIERGCPIDLAVRIVAPLDEDRAA